MIVIEEGMVPPIDHDCVLKDVVVEQANRIAKLEHELAQMKKALVGPKTERSKMPRPPRSGVSAAEQLASRRKNAETKAQTQCLRIEHKVPAELRVCPQCNGTKLKAVGQGRVTSVWEFVPATFVRHDHVQEVLKCPCGDYVVTAPGAPKVVEKGRYGASFLAHIAVAKLADHLPIYRLEKEMRRQGFPVARSTMNELLHRASDITRPLWTRLLDIIRCRPVVQADETRMRMQSDGVGRSKNGFVWTFVAADEAGGVDTALVFAADRSGETPRRILEGTAGYLVVDAYSGYNAVTAVSSRRRAGCHAHLRRYFHDALPTASIAQQAIDLILELYRAERAADDARLTGEDRLRHRREHAAPARTRLHAWLNEHRALHPQRSPIATAINYGIKRWDDLGVFLDDPRVPLDNNASERALRRVALGRKNYLFVGDVDAGTNIAGLYTLVATCEARGINPFAYLTDVIARVQDHPAAQLDELLPANWAAAQN